LQCNKNNPDFNQFPCVFYKRLLINILQLLKNVGIECALEAGMKTNLRSFKSLTSLAVSLALLAVARADDGSQSSKDASVQQSDSSSKQSDSSNQQSDSSSKQSDSSNQQSDSSNKQSDSSNQQSDSSNKQSESKAAVQTSITSPVQATQDPGGLPIAGKVQAAGTDAASKEFMTYMPNISAWLAKNLPEYTYNKNAASMVLDPSKLRLLSNADVRVYFVSEGAGYQNTLGLNLLPSGSSIPTASTPGIIKGDATLLFPNASSPVSTYDPSSTVKRTASAPLLPGDFVDLGVQKAGTLLDFFLISNGAAGGSSVFTDQTARNPDHLQHIATITKTNSPYMLLSFEDLNGGGDYDMNDVVFAIDFKSATLQKLVSAPEPGTWATLAGFMGMTLFGIRRRNKLNA
jgi:hypothetical protein